MKFNPFAMWILKTLSFRTDSRVLGQDSGFKAAFDSLKELLREKFKSQNLMRKLLSTNDFPLKRT